MGFFAFQGVADHVTLGIQRENAQFESFDTTEYVQPGYYDAKHDHLQIVVIIATIFDPGLNSPEILIQIIIVVVVVISYFITLDNKLTNIVKWLAQ